MWGRRRRNKYNNKKCVYQGIEFDSRKEMARFVELSILQRTGAISRLRLQPSFKISKGGVVDPATGRKMAARKYTADFAYIENGQQVVEEVKSKGTAGETAYRLRRQLFIEQYGDQVKFREFIY